MNKEDYDKLSNIEKMDILKNYYRSCQKNKIIKNPETWKSWLERY